MKAHDMSECTKKHASDKPNQQTGDDWRHCVQTISPNAEVVRHGENPNIGLNRTKKEQTLQMNKHHSLTEVSEGALLKIDKLLKEV